MHTVILCVAALLTGCTATRSAQQIRQEYASPATPDVQNSITIKDATFDQVWESIIAFFATQKISIETLEKDSGIVVAKRSLSRGSDGDGIVDIGEVTTTRSIVKQWLKPAGFAGSANMGVVRATGKITRQKLQPGSITSTSPAACRSAVSFNVFVTRFSESQLKVTINVDVSTPDTIDLWNGWVWRPFLEGASLQNTPQLISLLRENVAPTAATPQPVTTGALEALFLTHLRASLPAAGTSK